VLYCANNGEVLLSDSPDERLPMASTTKIMTTLLTLEEAAKDDRVVEFTDEMTAEGSSMYLKAGERVRLSDLAVGMMMSSGNDAANAAAIAIDGSIERFSVRMNRKAAELGMTNTHFVTPSGLDDEAHYSTARDMAILMAYALENDSFRELTARRSAEVCFVKPPSKRVTYPNHNRLLSMYDGCIGGKTGYTMTAGRCLVTAAERDGMRLICVTLDAPDDWDDHMKLYDYGFANYTSVNPGTTGFTVPVVGGDGNSVEVYPAERSGIVVPREDADSIQTTVILPAFLYAPFTRGFIAGSVVFTSDRKTLGVIPMLCAESIAFDNSRRGFFQYISDVLRL
jgi:D-alanyl-D-alanine carboxypeptidase/D-alanyl-D-alanine carboxypeptidase (penicillin-binding protein 5/6)